MASVPPAAGRSRLPRVGGAAIALLDAVYQVDRIVRCDHHRVIGQHAQSVEFALSDLRVDAGAAPVQAQQQRSEHEQTDTGPDCDLPSRTRRLRHEHGAASLPLRSVPLRLTYVKPDVGRATVI